MYIIIVSFIITRERKIIDKIIQVISPECSSNYFFINVTKMVKKYFHEMYVLKAEQTYQYYINFESKEPSILNYV